MKSTFELGISFVKQILTDCVHMRLKLGESPKSRILTKLGWIDQLMNVIDHALRFCYGSTLTVATADPKSDFYQQITTFLGQLQI